MSAVLNQFLAEANAAVEESGIDMNVAVAGGGGGRLLPEGYAFARLVEYVEFGQQPQEYNGQKKDPALEFNLGFALWGNAVDAQGQPAGTYHNDDGSPYIIRTFNKAMHRNDKAGAFKLFKALNWKGTAKGFPQLLGQTFLLKIKHVDKVKGDPTKGKTSRIDEAGFLPPLDPVTKAPYPIPEADDKLYRMFLWDRPTKAAWDSLYIEGQYEAKDGKPAASKNRIQETILAALDFQGSPLQQLLAGAGVTALPTAAAVPQAAVPQAAVPTPAAVAPVAPAAPVTPVVAAPLAQPAAPVAAPVAQPQEVAQAAVPSTPSPTLPSSPAIPTMPTIPVLPT